jgi:PAS domain S-box-containing protein
MGKPMAGSLGGSPRAKSADLATSEHTTTPARLRHLDALVDGQSQVLEMISHGHPLRDILEAIARWVEAQSRDGVLASLLLLDREGKHLLHVAAPSLPEAYTTAIHGVEIGPAVGSCGTAAFTREAVIVEDIAHDPFWVDYRELALSHGLRACWSTPLIGREGRVLGTFAMYYRHPRLPTADDQLIIQLVTRTAILAIEHKLAEDEREQLLVREQHALMQVQTERQRLHDLFMEAPAAIAVLRGPTHVIELANPFYQQIVGADRVLKGRTAREAFPELEGQGLFELLDAVYARGQRYVGREVAVSIYRTGARDLAERYFNFVYQPSRDETGAVDGILVHAVDVTDQVQARQSVEASEERYRTLFAAVPAAVYSCDANGVIREFNQRAVELWGQEPTAEGGVTRISGAFRLLSPNGTPVPTEELPMARVLRGEVLNEHDAELIVERPDGTRRHVVAHPAALRNPRGEIAGAINCVFDITERKQAEAAAAYLAAIVSSSSDAIVGKTLDGIITSWNASAQRMFGYTPEEIIGQSVRRLIPADRQSEEDRILARLRAGERIEHFETVRVTKDGRYFDVSLTISPIKDQSGKIIGASKIARDITERRQAEAAQRESEEKFRTLADNIPQLTWMAFPDGYIFWYNRRWYEYTGTTPETQEGWGWQSVHDPNELPRVLDVWRTSIATGEPFELVFPLRGADGVYRPFLTRSWPVKDEQGRVVRWFGTNTDVTEQVRLHEALRESERALQEANRRKDEFLSIASHELRTPLTSAKANVQVMSRHLERVLSQPAEDSAATLARLEPLRTLLRRSEHSLDRLAGLVDDLLDVSRIQAGKLEMRPHRVDLVDVVRDAVDEEAVLWPEREVRLLGDLREAREPVWVYVDPERIRQVVINYLSNALKYTPAGPPVEVRLDTAANGIPAGERVARVSVRDQGPGLTPEQQANLFERFYRVEGISHQQGSGLGLGLGLYISRTIVERHGGQVGVDSAPGHGSTFWFTLPLSEREGT